MSEAPRKQLVLEWEAGADFLEAFDEGVRPKLRTELTTEDAELGRVYSLLLRFLDRETEFQVHATLVGLEGRAATFELLKEEAQRHQLLLVSARGESLPYRRRRHTRIPCQLVASVKVGRSPAYSAIATDIGAGGAHLLLEAPIELDEEIRVAITFADGKLLELAARVTGRIDEGPERGCSVEFLFRSAIQRDEVAALTSRMAAESKS
jgi:hypothetical protein